MNPVIVDAFSKPQMGGELPYFVGKQYGSGWLRTLGRMAFPLLKRVGRFLGNTAKDVIVNEKPVVESLKKNAIQEVSKTFAPPTKRKKTINKHKTRGTIFHKR